MFASFIVRLTIAWFLPFLVLGLTAVVITITGALLQHVRTVRLVSWRTDAAWESATVVLS